MSHKITAIYENGVLRPLTPLDLPERSQIELNLQQVDASMNNTPHRDHVRHALITAGVSPATADVIPNATALTAERREELARLFATGQPLSQLISEDREGH